MPINKFSTIYMEEFFNVMGKYFANYKKYIIGALIVNILSAILNVVSFGAIMPILEILFGVSKEIYEFIPWETGELEFKEIFMNNIYYYSQVLIGIYGPATTLLLLGLYFLIVWMQRDRLERKTEFSLERLY